VRAAIRGDQKIIEQQLAAGVDVNGRENKRQRTALMCSAANGHESCFRVLLEAKADVNLQDSNGDTAIILSVQKKHIEIVRLLLAAKADPLLANKQGNAATFYNTVGDTFVELGRMFYEVCIGAREVCSQFRCSPSLSFLISQVDANAPAAPTGMQTKKHKRHVHPLAPTVADGQQHQLCLICRKEQVSP
jgi:hypothetical protein